MTTYAPHYYTGTGAQTDFSVSFLYLQKAQVKVTLDGTPTTAFTWVNASTIRFTSAPAADVRIKVYRDTSAGAVSWADGATILGRDLNLSYKIARYLAEEAVAENLDTLGLDASRTKWDAEDKSFINVPEPSAAGDVVTKEWAETGMTSQLTLAIAAKTAAETAESNAETAEAAAEAAQAAADASASAASASAATATTRASEAASSASTASTQATAAATARTNAETAEAAAEAAQAAAEAARDLAEGYKDAAAVSAASAASSVTAAATAYDNFDDRYLGQKAADPTVDNDGNALTVGSLYFDTVVNKMKSWTGASWALMYNDTVAASAVPNDSAASGTTVADALSNLATSVSGKANTSHTHAQSDITNLVSDLAAKANTSDVTTSLAGKADVDGSNITGRLAANVGFVASATNLNTIVSSGVYRMHSGMTNGPSQFTADWGIMQSARGQDVGLQILSDFSSGEIAWRSMHNLGSPGSENWGTWRRIAHDNNIGAVLAGKTVSGDLTVAGRMTATQDFYTSGASASFIFADRSNATYSYIYSVASVINLDHSSGGTLLSLTADRSAQTLRDSGGTQRQIVHAGNVATYAATFSESSETSVPNAATAATWTHGLGARPRLFGVRARCLTAENGYAVGDEVDLPTLAAHDSDAAAMHGRVITADATVVRWLAVSLPLRIPRKDSGVAGNCIPANWRLVFWAIK